LKLDVLILIFSSQVIFRFICS